MDDGYSRHMLQLGRVVFVACRESFERFSGALDKPYDADAYCDAQMDFGVCLSDHGMNGLDIRTLYDVLVGMHGLDEEPFICTPA